MAPGAQLTLSNTTIETKGGALSCSNATLQLDKSTLRRLNQIGTSAAAIATTTACSINTTQDGNHFCDESLTQGNTFAAAISGPYSGTMMLGKQVNGGVPDACP